MQNKQVYSDKGLVIEELKPKKQKSKAVETVSVEKEVPKEKMSFQDYILVTASYLADPFQMIANQTEGAGTCVECGVKTNKAERKLCPKCFKENKEEIIDILKSGKV